MELKLRIFVEAGLQVSLFSSDKANQLVVPKNVFSYNIKRKKYIKKKIRAFLSKNRRKNFSKTASLNVTISQAVIQLTQPTKVLTSTHSFRRHLRVSYTPLLVHVRNCQNISQSFRDRRLHPVSVCPSTRGVKSLRSRRTMCCYCR